MRYLIWPFLMLYLLLINLPGWCWAKARGKPYTPIGGVQ